MTLVETLTLPAKALAAIAAIQVFCLNVIASIAIAIIVIDLAIIRIPFLLFIHIKEINLLIVRFYTSASSRLALGNQPTSPMKWPKLAPEFRVTFNFMPFAWIKIEEVLVRSVYFLCQLCAP